MLNEVPNRGTPMPPTDPLISARDRETATGFAGQTCRGWGTREKGNVSVNW
jgi:hypothetical protein